MYQTILYTIENQVATVTINREEYGNAFSETTYQEIIDVMVDIDQNPEVKAVILTGVGKYFCAGGDVKYFQHLIDTGQGIPEDGVLKTGEMVRSIRQNSKPVIAAINGVAAGAGLGLALSCDFIVMGTQSRLLTAFINMAFPGDTGLMYNLQQALGSYRTMKHIMLNEPIDAKLAVEYGLAYSQVADEDLLDEAQVLAQKLAHGPTQTIAYQKALLASVLYPQMDETNRLEAKYMRASSLSGDHSEAVEAFLSKRQPKFKGN